LHPDEEFENQNCIG